MSGTLLEPHASGTLYVVATPIGNLEDISARAVRILGEVDAILAEDTRQAGKILSHYEIVKPILSYHQHSSEQKKEEILAKLLSGENLALVTDAGTPGVGDPGNELIDFLLAREPQIKIVPIPGPSSLTAALSICGLNVSKFIFLGFLPKKGRQKLLTTLAATKLPIVFFESPYRIAKTIDWLIGELGEDREVFVGQELTKIHERTLRGSLRSVREALEQEQKKLGRIKGELVCILTV